MKEFANSFKSISPNVVSTLPLWATVGKMGPFTNNSIKDLPILQYRVHVATFYSETTTWRKSTWRCLEAVSYQTLNVLQVSAIVWMELGEFNMMELFQLLRLDTMLFYIKRFALCGQKNWPTWLTFTYFSFQFLLWCFRVSCQCEVYFVIIWLTIFPLI